MDSGWLESIFSKREVTDKREGKARMNLMLELQTLS